MNGFDCSANFQPVSLPSESDRAIITSSPSKTNSSSQIKISIIAPTTQPTHHHHHSASDSPKIGSYLLSPNLLLSPSIDMFQFPSKLASNLSNSFNCLSAASRKQFEDQQQFVLKSPISSSDSNLKSTKMTTCKNIFNFGDFLLSPLDQMVTRQQQQRCNKPPLSPYRSKSPLLSTSFETPPSSPLTPIAVLQTLPAFMLAPIFQWLYSECLPPNLDEETCEKLINFAESTIPLNKMVEPLRQYLKLIKLKKCKCRQWKGMIRHSIKCSFSSSPWICYSCYQCCYGCS